MAEGVDARGEGDLALVDVAETGEHALVEQDVRDLVVGVRLRAGAQGAEAGLGGVAVAQDVGAEFGNAGLALER